jgi:hypothetical protein
MADELMIFVFSVQCSLFMLRIDTDRPSVEILSTGEFSLVKKKL